MTDAERKAYEFMKRAGMRPRDALAAIRDARKLGDRLPTDREIEADAATPPDPGRFVWDPAVPLQYKTLLDAPEVEDATD